MIKLKINGVVVKEFTLHNDSVGFVPYTIDTFTTYARPMYYQPVYQPQPISYIQPSMAAMCANTMPAIEEPVVENKPIRLFAGIRHGEHESVNVNDPEKYRNNPNFEKYLSVMKDTLGDFTTALDNNEFCDLADIGECNANELLDIATGVAEINKLQNECNLNETIATILKPDTDFNVDSERTREWVMSGRAYIWFISQQAFINKDSKRVKFITQNLGSACTDIYNAAVGVICAFCKKYNEKFPTPFNSNVFDMPISKISKNVSNDSTGILTNVINTKAGGMYEE